MMLFRKASFQQGVPNRAGKRDVEDSFAMEVSDFGPRRIGIPPLRNGEAEKRYDPIVKLPV
jgi:hypothetical protein